MESVKAKTPAKTPKSAKKNDKSKTPVAKNTPMADTPRPVLSAKKQNGIQSAGKPTPNKKGNATPKKTPKPEQKKKGKTPVKKVEEEEEEDDEDDDDDSEIEFNPEIMKKLAEMADSDDDEEDDDDDDDDDDEDMEDDDDDDDEDGDELMDEEQLKMLIKSLKEKKKKAKNGEKEVPAKKEAAAKEPAAKPGKKAKAPAAAVVEKVAPAPKKETKKEAAAAKKAAAAAKEAAPDAAAAAPAPEPSSAQNLQIKSVGERDMRTLFLKGLPIAIQEEAIKKLSPDIQGLRLRKRIRRDPKKTAIYAFIEFETEAIAEKNFKLLSDTKLEGKDLFVDYMGGKSIHRPNKPSVIKELDAKKLYITGFPYETTELEMKQLFPKAESVIMLVKGQSKKPLGFAFAKFEDADVCADEMNRLNGKSFKGCRLVVLYANKIDENQKKTQGQKRKTQTTTGKAKKAKLEKPEEEEEEDDEDEEEEEDDDDEEEEDDDEEDEE